MTRTPDAHFLTEVRYKGTKVVSVSPDYAESTTSSDAWLNVKAGTDAALAMAMGHVILKEYYIDKETPYFKEYAKEFTDMPFLVRVEDINGAVQPGRFLNAKDLGSKEDGADFQTVLIDETTNEIVVPNGTMGDRHTNPQKWNLRLETAIQGLKLTLAYPYLINGRCDYR